ncbi:hypothetical protein [Janibacter limosus]
MRRLRRQKRAERCRGPRCRSR